MTRLSVPFERLIADMTAGGDDAGMVHDADIVVVGSGYGAAMAALRLAGARDREGRSLSLTVLERGREYLAGEFPEDEGMLPRHIRITRDAGDGRAPQQLGYEEGLFDIRLASDVNMLVGNGLGGGSLINAGVAEEPDLDHLTTLPLPAGWRAYMASAAYARDHRRIRRLLGATCDPAPQDETRYQALERLGEAIGAPARPACLTVAFREGRNALGVHQEACTRCGNCVTGCNVGAKRTLTGTVLPLALARGARLVTGAQVVAVERDAGGRRWRLRVRRTAASAIEKSVGPELWSITADHVVLAAGTLGSTEILMRSAAAPGSARLALSPRLGFGFSTNGDGIAMAWGQARPVHPLGMPEQRGGEGRGPTIRGIVRARLDADGRAVKRGGTPVAIEDGAVPHALRHLFGELLVTGAQFNRLADGTDVKSLLWPREAAWLAQRRREGRPADPLAASAGSIAHSQLLLVMGDDGAQGRLVLRGEGVRAGLVPVWPGAAGNATLQRVDACLAGQDRRAGFDGGQYVPNPAWRLLPEAAASVMSGALPGGATVSVHPLGGCAAADSGAFGVVDDAGRVFGGEGTAVHEGLYVMDGAVMPGAVAVNPFQIISVMAWRAAGLMLAREGWQTHRLRRVDAARARPEQVPVARGGSGPVTLQFSEMLAGKPHGLPKPVLDELAGGSADGTLRVCSTLTVPDLDTWLDQPGDTLLQGRAELVDARGKVRDGWQDGNSEVRLLVADRPGALRRIYRAGVALHTYVRRRGGGAFGPLTGERIRGFLSVAMMHSHYRTLRYRFEWRGAGGRRLVIEGRKRLAYRHDNRPVFEAMTVLDAWLLFDDGRRRHRVRRFALAVDLLSMTGARQPALTAMPHLPAALHALGRVATFTARCMLQTAFWEFGIQGEVDAAQHARLRAPDPSALPLTDRDGRAIRPAEHRMRVPLDEQDTVHRGEVVLRRYAQPCGGEPVVLLHGLAQGSRIFTTELDLNMASAMWQAGYEVWLVDYRLSNLLLPAMQDHDWAIEDIARYDIAPALHFIADQYRKDGREVALRVFAHCVGATALSMALLSGWLKDVVLSHVALNAIHPWLRPSIANNLRARLGGLFRDVLNGALLDPRPSLRPGIGETLFDRVAMALARYHEAWREGMDVAEYPPDDPAPHHRTDKESAMERTMCDRMTVLYGRMWKHSQLDPRTHRDFLQMLGPSPVSIYRQLYYLMRRGRITDRNGENVFLTEANVRGRWTPATLFMHGEDSEVFDPVSATLSALRLRRLHTQPGRVHAKRFPGLGHMDVVFARTAAQQVYPLLLRFFADRLAATDTDTLDPAAEPGDDAVNRPLLGPLIRGARRHEGALHLDLWVELNPYETSPQTGCTLRPATPVSTRVPDDAHGARYFTVSVPHLPAHGPFHLHIVRNGEDIGPARVPHPHHESQDMSTLDIAGKPWFRRLAGSMPLSALRFAVGSCRYPAQFMDRERSDSAHSGLLRHVDGHAGLEGLDLVFMVGDQIYADATAGIADSADWRERYVERYRAAFGSEAFAALGRSVPVHFAIDDHEIGDDWSGHPAGTDAPLAAHGVRAARLYQGSPAATGSSMAYALPHDSEVAFPVFVMDARTQRSYRDRRTLRSAHMMDTGQQRALCDWLIAVRARPGPKFIVGSVVIAPLDRRAGDGHPVMLCDGRSWTEDGWCGYPATLRWLIEEIVRQDVRHVVFVGGDLHLSAVAELELHALGRTVRATQIVSSGLYAPLPFAGMQREEVQDVACIELDPSTRVDYRARAFRHGDRNFVRVDAEPGGPGHWVVTARCCDHEGAITDRHTVHLSDT